MEAEIRIQAILVPHRESKYAPRMLRTVVRNRFVRRLHLDSVCSSNRNGTDGDILRSQQLNLLLVVPRLEGGDYLRV